MWHIDSILGNHVGSSYYIHMNMKYGSSVKVMKSFAVFEGENKFIFVFSYLLIFLFLCFKQLSSIHFLIKYMFGMVI